MELLQRLSDRVFVIAADGVNAANPGIYDDLTNSIGSWVDPGLKLTDGKILKQEVKRIVELEAGATIDDKFNALASEYDKRDAARELLFDLQKATVVPSVMSEAEYEAAKIYRQQISAAARQMRWSVMLSQIASPDVLVQSGKFAFLVTEIEKYKDHYLVSDDKIFEAFIAGTDHPYSALAGYPLAVDFATTPANSMNGLSLWDDQALGGPDATYKSLVTGIITGTIVNADQYITVS